MKYREMWNRMISIAMLTTVVGGGVVIFFVSVFDDNETVVKAAAVTGAMGLILTMLRSQLMSSVVDEIHTQGNSRWSEIKNELKLAQNKIDSLQERLIDRADEQGD